MNLERRLAERASTLSLAQYDTKERLRELVAALEEARAIASQLPEGVDLPVAAPLPATRPAAAPDPAPTPPPVKEPPPTPANLTGTYVMLAGIALALLASAFLGRWIWQRIHAPKKKQRPLSEAWTAMADDGFQAKTASAQIFNPQAPSALEDSHDVADYAHPKDVADSISVSDGFDNEYDDPFTAHLEAAEIMICFGRYQSAAAEVSAFIQENPDCGLRPRLALLSVYRRGEMRADFDQLAEELSAKFNLAKPAWEPSEDAEETSRNLDAFPHIVSRITELWDTPECLAYIQHLTRDKRDGIRKGFTVEVANELALLESMLQLRYASETDLVAKT